MADTRTCNFTKNYSKIENIQPAYKVTYSVEVAMNDALLTMSYVQDNDKRSMKCLCENTDFDHAENLAKFLYENSIGLDNWLDVLQDNQVQFKLIK